MEDFEPTTEALGVVPNWKGPQAQKQLCLVVVNGAEKGAVFPLNAGETSLGRSAQHADIVVSGRGLSRVHVRIKVAGDRVEVEDLQSTNGMFVNGERKERSLLSPGDTLTLGPEVSMRLDAPDQSIQSLLQEMHRGATEDSLTGLLNRRSFLGRLQEEVLSTSRHSLQTCVAMIDIDRFKSVNDTYGHPAGDAVLVGVAQRLGQGMRGEDILARYGGEEFVLLLRYTDLKGAQILLDRLRERVAGAPFEVPTPDGTQNLQVTFSGGIAQLLPGETGEQALERADVGLYEAKRGGRNRVVCKPAEV